MANDEVKGKGNPESPAGHAKPQRGDYAWQAIAYMNISFHA